MTLHPTRRGLAVFAIGLLPALLPALGLDALWTIWLGWSALALTALAVDALRLPRVGSWDLELPRVLYVGRAIEAKVELAGPERAELQLDLSDADAGGPGALTPEGGAVSIRPSRRGKLYVETLWVRYPGPMGLVQRTQGIPVDRVAPVLPDAELVRAQALRFSLRKGGFSGSKVEKFQGQGTEFEALRDFQPGMDTRSIDWRASARHGALKARQYRAERNHQIVLAIDTGRRMAEPLEGMPRLDHAIHAALRLGWVSLRQGDRVGLYAFDDSPRGFTSPRGGGRAIAGLIGRCGELEYSSAETNYTVGLTDLMNRLRRRSLVIVMTDFEDTITAELMIENLQRLARRHLVVFVALRDPLLPALAGAAPNDMRDVERAVVADALLQERELVLTRLRRVGVRCVDATPAEIGGALISRYLDILRREMI